MYRLLSCVILVSLTLAVAGSVPDGFYLEDLSGKSPLQIVVKDPKGEPRTFSVVAYTNLTVKRISVYSLRPDEDGTQLEIHLSSSDSNWSKKSLALIIQGKAYFELTKSSAGSNGSVSIKVPSERVANVLASSLRKRFGLEMQ